MAKTKKLTIGKTIIDVAHPDSSAPAANSKSVIVNNRQILKDPMMVDDDATTKGPSDNSLATISNKSHIQPLTAPLLKTEEPDPPVVEKAVVMPDKPTETKSVSDEPPAKEPEKSDRPEQLKKPEKPAPPNPTTPAPEPSHPGTKPESEPEPKLSETGTEETATPPPKDDKAKAEADKAAQHQAAIDKLAGNKQYYLPINTVEKRRSRRFVILGLLLSVLLALAWVDIALDAGLIQINNVKPLTHFFSN